MIMKVLYISLCSGEKVVDAQNLMTELQHPVDQERSQKTCAAGDEYALSISEHSCH